MEKLSPTELIKKYKRYIEVMAFKFRSEENIQDLIQEGKIGLLVGYEKYDESKGELHFHLINYIRKYMQKFLTKNARTIRIPESTLFSKEFEEMKMVSGDKEIFSDDETTIFDTVSTDYFVNDYCNSSEVTKELIQSLIAKLKPKHQQVIRYYFFDELTYQGIAYRMNCSVQNVENSLKQALIKLRELINK